MDSYLWDIRQAGQWASLPQVLRVKPLGTDEHAQRSLCWAPLLDRGALGREATVAPYRELLLHVLDRGLQRPCAPGGLVFHCLHSLEEGGDIGHHHLHRKKGQEETVH